MAEHGYSFSLTTFSPSGKLVQIEYALAAVAGGAPSVGIKAANGMVLATEKKQKSILYDEQSVHKVEPITKHIGLVYSGMGPDYRYLVSPSREFLVFDTLGRKNKRCFPLIAYLLVFCSVEQQQLKLVICQYEADWGLLEGELSAPHLLKEEMDTVLSPVISLLFCHPRPQQYML